MQEGQGACSRLVGQVCLAALGAEVQGRPVEGVLTFNLGWDRNTTPLASFDDVREIQQALQARGLTLVSAAAESSTGPASLMLIDPDGNPILIDQHVPKPAR